jgi:hypothetical protein
MHFNPFPTDILLLDVPDFDHINDAIIDLVSNVPTEIMCFDSVKNHNYDFWTIYENSVDVMLLKKQCILAAEMYLEKFCGGSYDLFVEKSWVNKDYIGHPYTDYKRIHNHFGKSQKVSLSLCYYIRTSGEPNGVATFRAVDPRFDNVGVTKFFDVRVKPGNLLVFPNWLKHVGLCESTYINPRISIATNIHYRTKQVDVYDDKGA